MSKFNFSQLTRQELRIYIRQHPTDDEAFYFYDAHPLAESGEFDPAPQTIDDLKDFPFLKRRATFH